jgi:hypothetical protein
MAASGYQFTGRERFLGRGEARYLERKLDPCDDCPHVRQEHPFKRGQSPCSFCPCQSFRGKP